MASMRYRVYVVAAEYSAPLSILSRTPMDSYGHAPAVESERAHFERLFFSAPDDSQSWADLGAEQPPTLSLLLASAAYRALGAFHDLCGGDDFAETRWSISDLLVASMPLLGNALGSGVNAGLIPLMLRATLGLEFHCRCQFVAGTADSGAGALATAMRIAQSRPATILVTAGQLIPSGYMGQYRIRSVFAEDEQARGLDMMAVGDLLMDALRRAHAGPGMDLGGTQDWLEKVRRSKAESAAAYPAALGVAGADPSGGDKFVTRYFRNADVAKAGCGAAAVVVTSDPAVLGRIRRGLSKRARRRHRNTPVVEIMGTGEGTTNPRILARHSPLTVASSIRQALVTAADDAELPLSVYPDSAFAVLHDAFPSMEMAFLLAIGLDWQRASLRMTTWWSNPYGGLLTFGDAVGASGLVQVCKAFHCFSGDRRYIPRPLPSLRHFRREGSFSFTTSIGGPLSHVVVSILRGGVPLSRRDQDVFFDEPQRVSERHLLAPDEHRQRRRQRDATAVYARRLAAHEPGLHLIEGTTEVDARSCAQALGEDEIDALRLERLRFVVLDQFLDVCRAEVIALIHDLRVSYLAASGVEKHHAARQRYNAGLLSLLDRWRQGGMLRAEDDIHRALTRGAGNAAREARADLSGLDEAARRRILGKALKQCVRVPMAFLVEAATPGRKLYFVPDASGLERADFMTVVPERRAVPGDMREILPWWNNRAERPSGTLSGADKVQADPDQVFEALMSERPLASECAAELAFLRAYFAPSGPQAAVDLAMRDLGVRPAVDSGRRGSELVPAIFYKNDIIGSSSIENVHEAYELLGRAVQRARGWFGMYASTCAQHGDSVSLVSLDRRLEPGGPDGPRETLHARAEAISNSSRFARDVAEWCLGYGVRLRAVVSIGLGVPYRDVNDDRSVASDSAIRGARLLDHVTAAAVEYGFAHLPWLVFDRSELGDIDDAVEIFERELRAASGPGWRMPLGPESPVALERWDDVRFTVWYRPD